MQRPLRICGYWSGPIHLLDTEGALGQYLLHTDTLFNSHLPWDNGTILWPILATPWSLCELCFPAGSRQGLQHNSAPWHPLCYCQEPSHRGVISKDTVEDICPLRWTFSFITFLCWRICTKQSFLFLQKLKLLYSFPSTCRQMILPFFPLRESFEGRGW